MGLHPREKDTEGVVLPAGIQLLVRNVIQATLSQLQTRTHARTQMFQKAISWHNSEKRESLKKNSSRKRFRETALQHSWRQLVKKRLVLNTARLVSPEASKLIWNDVIYTINMQSSLSVAVRLGKCSVDYKTLTFPSLRRWVDTDWIFVRSFLGELKYVNALALHTSSSSINKIKNNVNCIQLKNRSRIHSTFKA